MKSDLSVQEFDSKLHEVMNFVFDVWMPNDAYVDIMTNAPLSASFCDANEKSICDTTIIMMAFKIICQRYDIVYWHRIDDWLDRFKRITLKRLNPHFCED